MSLFEDGTYSACSHFCSAKNWFRKVDSVLIFEENPDHGACAFPGLNVVSGLNRGYSPMATVGVARWSKIGMIEYLLRTGRMLYCGCRGADGTLRTVIRSFSSLDLSWLHKYNLFTTPNIL